jgi:hypothetical protein
LPGGGGVGDDAKVRPLDDEDVAIEGQVADARVQDGLSRRGPDSHAARGPEGCEGLVGSVEFAQQRRQGRVVGVASGDEAEVRDQSGGPLLVLGVGEDDTARAVGERAPHQVAVAPVPAGRVAHQRRPEWVPRQQVPGGVQHGDRCVAEAVEDPLHPRRDALGDEPGSGVGQTGEVEQVVALGVLEPQRPGGRPGDLRRRVACAALLEPHEVVHGDPGQAGHLFAAQPRRPAGPERGQADIVGRQPLAPRA